MAVRTHATRNWILIVAFIVLGLGTVPVECAAVYGPHSVFISADAVAGLRALASGSHDLQPVQGHTHMQPGSATGEGHAITPGAVKTSPMVPGQGAHNRSETVFPSLQAAAGMMVDALIALAIFETPAGPAVIPARLLPSLAAQPVNQVSPAPEPPPPQRLQ